MSSKLEEEAGAMALMWHYIKMMDAPPDSLLTSPNISTMTTNNVIDDLFSDAVWASINVNTYINQRFKFVLDSRCTIAALFALAEVC
jgi:hypothetical protein